MLGKKNKPLNNLRTKSDSSQAALEFLMTYGWAILVVIGATAVLAYFGVLSPENFLPNRCAFPAGLACLDYNVETYKVVLVLQNGLGDLITINQVTVSGNNQQCSDNETIILNNEAKAIITITQCNNGVGDSKFDGTINVTYTAEEKLTHSAIGTLKTKVVAGIPISAESACQNAETNGLCDGLDIVYGIGYKAACCSEHGLCC